HLRGLGVNRGVQVGDLESGLAHLCRDLAEEGAAVGVLVPGIGVGEVPADVAERCGSEQRVADRVDQDVGVGVTGEALLEGDRDAAVPGPAARGERVDVESLADPHPSSLSAISRSAGKVTLRFVLLPSTTIGL